MNKTSVTDTATPPSPGAGLDDIYSQRTLSLKGNFSWTMLGNIVYAGCQWGILILLAKLGSPEMVGRFAYGLAVTAPVYMFASLGLRPVLVTDTGSDYDFADYLGLRIITTAMAFLIVLGFAGITGFHREVAFVVIAVGLSKAFESISDIYYGYYQQKELMSRIAQSMILKGMLSVVFMGLVVHITSSVFWGTMALATVWCIILFWFDRRGIGKCPDNISNKKWDPIIMKRLVFLSLPLGVSTMLISLTNNIPRYFIERTAGERELGLFAAMAYLMVAGSMVVNALGQAASPQLAKYYANKNRHDFRLLLARLVLIGVLLGVAGIAVVFVAGREILAIIYSLEYAEHSNILLLLMVAASTGYVGSFLGYGVTASRIFNPQPVVFGVSALVSIAACVLLVPTYGIAGGAWACILVNAFQLAVMSCLTLHALRLLKD